MDKNCPICNKKLTMNHQITRVDYHCYPAAKDHHYAERNERDLLTEIKIRISPNKDKLFLKVDFKSGNSEVWTTPDDRANSIRINHIIPLEFDDMKKLEDKIRTYLLFS